MNRYYKILGLKPGASLKEIKSAYKRKAMLLHPDVNSSPTAKDDFIQLKLAYEYLSSPRRKIMPKSVKRKATHQQKRKAHTKQKTRQHSKQERYKKRRKPIRKEVEEITWSMVKIDLLRIGKAFIGGTTLIFILILPLLLLGNSTFWEILFALFVTSSFIGFFSLIVLVFLLLATLPDLLNKK